MSSFILTQEYVRIRSEMQIWSDFGNVVDWKGVFPLGHESEPIEVAALPPPQW